MSGRYGSGVHWSQLKHQVETALRGCGRLPAGVRCEGWLQRLGEGCNHKAFCYRVEAPDGAGGQAEQVYVVRMRGGRWTDDEPSPPVDDGGMIREMKVLRWLAQRRLPFETPRFICEIGEDPLRPEGFIETAVSGAVPLEWLQKNPNQRDYLTQTTAALAGAIHALPTDGLDFLPRHPDSRSHVQALLGEFPEDFLAVDPAARAAAEYIRAHVGPARPAVFLHGDLLAQNLLRDIATDALAVVDWEFASIGDPAHDLAIVTRGNSKLFGAVNGRRRLLTAYAAAGGTPLAAAAVICHELLMVIRWLWQALRDRQDHPAGSNPPEHYRDKIAAILRRAD
ncbi:MAG: phosphotransferase [Planctomycetota bacterium]|nr:phosphotransferase [Planctomycetota bacterium]